MSGDFSRSYTFGGSTSESIGICDIIFHMKKPPFLNDQIYHIYNRGVEKRNIFMDDYDYLKFIHDLYEFNDENPVDKAIGFQLSEVEPPKVGKTYKYKRYRKISRKPLIEIFVFELMPNHFHLMVRQLIDGGIVKFMQKLGTGYTMSFNEKYDRVGPLFQGSFKAVMIERDAHLMYLPHYIHLNSLDLITFGGRTSESAEEKMEFLENYRWSSLPDYLGKKNFPSITERDFILDSVGGIKAYKKAIKEFLVSENEHQIRESVISVALD